MAIYYGNEKIRNYDEKDSRMSPEEIKALQHTKKLDLNNSDIITMAIKGICGTTRWEYCKARGKII